MFYLSNKYQPVGHIYMPKFINVFLPVMYIHELKIKKF